MKSIKSIVLPNKYYNLMLWNLQYKILDPNISRPLQSFVKKKLIFKSWNVTSGCYNYYDNLYRSVENFS